MNRKFLFHFLLILFLTSCKKNSSEDSPPPTIDSKISGIVTDQKTGTPLSNLKIYLLKHSISGYSYDYSSSAFLNSKGVVVDSTIADVNGSFQFNKALTKSYATHEYEGPTFYHTVGYSVSAETSEHFKFNAPPKETSATMEMNIALSYAGFLRVNFKNLYGQYAGISFDAGEIFWSDSTVLLKYLGDTTATVNYELFNENKLVNYYSTIKTGAAKEASFIKMLKAQDTLFVILEF